MNPEVNSYFNNAKKWQIEMEKLRTIVLDCGLTEVLKWGVPCYLYQNNNIVLIHAFKDYCAFLFVKGALLHDSETILIQEFQIRFNKDSKLKKAFESLTPGRQKAYLIYFSAPKQTKTRESRIESYTKRILNGKGLYDCVCGLSKKMPSCDGSHKLLADK
jgi:uncharacterized protein YdeI (YjbR/CyaY-like superfamily)